MVNLVIYSYLETPCRKIFDTRVFFRQKGWQRLQKDDISGKNVQSKNAKHMVYQKKHVMWLNCSPEFPAQFREFLAQFREFPVQKNLLIRKRLYIEGWWQLNHSPDHWIWKKTTFRVKKAQFGRTCFFPFVLFFLHTLEWYSIYIYVYSIHMFGGSYLVIVITCFSVIYIWSCIYQYIHTFWRYLDTYFAAFRL